jgi:NADH-quinone oxidoreductase subunit C
MVDVRELLMTRFGDAIRVTAFRDNTRYLVPAEHLTEVMTVLRDQAGFDFLADLTAVDYLRYPNAADRYGLIYCLANSETAKRIVVKVMVNDPDPSVASICSIWKGAEWMEREVYDMYGIHFEGHPDLRRILMPEGFDGHPLRKDYPLRGRGERHNFATIIRSES